MNIKIIAVGKIRENYIKQGIEEFLKRLRPYAKVTIVEIPAQDIKDENLAEKYKETEAKKIIPNIKDSSYTITMEIKGKGISSEVLAEKIESIGTQGCSDINFIIGGANGLHKSVSSKANFKLSLSSMTLPHQIARLVLIEQIYRAYRIAKGEPYHR